ncbi:hypothetical protein PHK61_26685 [Actinomycetospora lutea]|uniref:hypothetical protein n=1 Tax=Actinomycetospora lutea TaxID=663604 RepID=UPI002365414C|nr:hypothetical protein [Actinomycetospora lutea]MDD7942008.1 hypothetical protein [Actinomycetospora lutea]
MMEAVQAAGGVMDFTTYTVRNHKGHRLRDVWDAVSAAWRAVTGGEECMRDKDGLLGWARIVEITHTARAVWHVHAHVIYAWASAVSERHSA